MFARDPEKDDNDEMAVRVVAPFVVGSPDGHGRIATVGETVTLGGESARNLIFRGRAVAAAVDSSSAETVR